MALNRYPSLPFTIQNYLFNTDYLVSRTLHITFSPFFSTHLFKVLIDFFFFFFVPETILVILFFMFVAIVNLSSSYTSLRRWEG